mmetsp:Transcript_32274/g.37632  ORF Transcript_32274/g.37632 Transcript_32274/m.37632 type:complete len:1352 (+) Transcript_32274:164-4219(+)
MLPSQQINAGDIVLTTYGVAVVISCNDCKGEQSNHLSSFKARLWRVPGKSVASSTTAYLQYDCVIRQLPAAPGMITTELKDTDEEESKDILIHCYSPYKDSFLVSLVDEEASENYRVDIISVLSKDEEDSPNNNDDNRSDLASVKLYELKSDRVEKAKCAKFYGLIDELILRGNEAAQTAKNVVNTNPKLKELEQTIIRKTSSAESKKKDEELESTITGKVDKVREAIKSSAPDSENVRDIYNMLKDEELTLLFEKGRERLQELTSSNIMNEAENTILKEMGITINHTSFTFTTAKAQQYALDAIDDMLSENLEVDFLTVYDAFGTMFDSFTDVAKSDATLQSLLGEINTKTSEWQKQTGRLLDTKSGGLFFEGAQRLQARVSNLLSPKLVSMCENSGSSLTKAFTEGDVALAKLKSLELGDSVRSRLFNAIEARSESHGGLDGIIAGAVTQIGGEDVLAAYRAGSSMSDKAHESLISMLGKRSEFHDISILRLEQTLVHLESHFDEDLSSDQIAAFARGESGTAALFEPIAQNAAKEIEKQLDLAEKSVEDTRILAAIAHVRKIMSGELTVSNLVDEIANVLNNDEFLSVGVNIAQTGEHILDAIETASQNKGVSDILSVVEQAGVSKESIIDKIEQMDMNTILDTAEKAMSDEEKRAELLSSATDSALDFMLRILPSMPIQPFDGVRDGLIYSMSNLSMKGFKLKKEDIMVEIAGIQATSYSKSSGTIIPDDLNGNNDVSVRQVKATDVLIIDVRNISALLEDALWSFEQTSFPSLKGNGSANVNLSEGYMRLEFELRKMKQADSQGQKTYSPVLCLHKASCAIGQIDLTLDSRSRLTWVVNKLATIFRGPLRDYVVRVIVDLLKNKSGWLLENLNSVLSSHWDLILQTAGLTMDDLAEANEEDIITATPDPLANVVDLVWTEHIPLGINLIANEKGGRVRVQNFARGSQARQVAVSKGFDPNIFIGSIITAVNGTYFDKTERVDLILALKDSSRPKTVKFQLLTTHKAQNIEQHEKEDLLPQDMMYIKPVSIQSLSILEEGPIGISFSTSADNNALIVESFTEDGLAKTSDTNNLVHVGDILASVNQQVFLEESGPWIQKAYECLTNSGVSRPLTLGFIRPYLHKIRIEKSDTGLQNDGPQELGLKEKRLNSGLHKIVVSEFCGVDGAVESGGALIGDQLIFVNGLPVGVGLQLRPECKFYDLKSVQSMINDESMYPICLNFARQTTNSLNRRDFDMESIKTVSIVANSPQQLGCVIGQGKKTRHFILKKFNAVSGAFHEAMLKNLDESLMFKDLSFFSIDEEPVPSYASCDMVMNAMKRSWKNKKKIEIILCDHELKERVAKLSQFS